jgi:hypothetical protein
MAENIVLKIFADDRTKRAFSSVGAGLSKMAKAAAAFGAAATGATAALTISAARSADQLAKTADKIGATTEALAGLQYAAELSGVSTETMNMALQRMTRRVSEAAMGTGEAKAALFELGLNAQELEQLPLDVQMGMIADAMKGVGSQADRVRIAMKLFDSEGVALVNTLAGGSAELNKLAYEADVLGLAISRVDAAKIEEANDSIFRAKQVFTGLGNQLATAFAPIVTAVATDFRQTAIEQAETGNVGQRVVIALLTAYGKLQDGILGVQVFFMKLKVATQLVGAAMIGAFSDVGGAIDFLIEKYNFLARSAFGQKLGLEEIPVGVERAMLEAQGNLIGAARETQEEILAILTSQKPSDSILEWYQEVQAKAQETAEAVASNAAGMGGELDTRTQEQKDNATKLKEFEVMTAKEKTTAVLAEANNQFSHLGRINKKFFAAQKAFQIAQAIMNTFTGATNALERYPPPLSFAMAALTVANGMAQVAQIRSQSFEGGGFTGFGARSGGVDGRGGFPAILHPNETVVDHSQGQGMGANVTFNIQANDTEGFDNLLFSRRGAIMSMINEALNDQGRLALA